MTTAYIVTNLHNKQTLASNSADAPIEPTALTQMMTAYLVFKALEDGMPGADRMLTVSNTTWKIEGSRMFLSPEASVSVSSLIKGTTIQPASGTAITLIEAIGNDSTDRSVKQMNEKTKHLGMKYIHFNNPTGISSNGHVSAVGDLVILATMLVNDYPRYYPLLADKSSRYNNVKRLNRNLLLYRSSNIDGLKTGCNEGAGYRLAVPSKRNNRRAISVLTSAKPIEARTSESSKLLDWSLQTFDTPKLHNDGEVISQAKVYKGSTETVDISFLDDVHITIPHDTGKNVKSISETLQPVLAPIERDQALSKPKIIKDGKIITGKDVVVLSDVKEGSWLHRV